MRYNERIKFNNGTNVNVTAEPMKYAVCVMGLAATAKTTKVRYRKVDGKWKPVSINDMALHLQDQMSENFTEPGSLQDQKSECPEFEFNQIEQQSSKWKLDNKAVLNLQR